MIKHYREHYGLFVCSGIMYNHESELRNISMVTRKITNGVAKIASGSKDKIVLGNLDDIRDWSYAPDLCEGMYSILQYDKPDEYIMSCGIPRTIKDFLDVAFGVVRIDNWSDWVIIDPKFIRPVEQEPLYGDNSKLKSIGWTQRTSFEEMVRIMVHHDTLELENDKNNIPM